MDQPKPYEPVPCPAFEETTIEMERCPTCGKPDLKWHHAQVFACDDVFHDAGLPRRINWDFSPLVDEIGAQPDWVQDPLPLAEFQPVYVAVGGWCAPDRTHYAWFEGPVDDD